MPPCKKGFKEDKSNQKYYIYHHPDGKKSIVNTMVSHGSIHKTIEDYLLKKMADQLKLTKPKFLELVDCTMDQEAHEKAAFPERQKPTQPKNVGTTGAQSAASTR